MANISEKFGGGGGLFVPSFISGALSITSGSPAGDIITIDPAAEGFSGGRVVLYKLSVNTGAQPGISISGSIQGEIVSGELEDIATTGGDFNVGTPRDTSIGGTIPSVSFEPDEVVTVAALAETVEDIYYQYAIGYIK